MQMKKISDTVTTVHRHTVEITPSPTTTDMSCSIHFMLWFFIHHLFLQQVQVFEGQRVN